MTIREWANHSPSEGIELSWKLKTTRKETLFRGAALVSFPTKFLLPCNILCHSPLPSKRFLLPTSNSLFSPAMANMLILFYLFCSGKMEDNLTGIFNLFDQDGNKAKDWFKFSTKKAFLQIITLNELYELMSVFIEIAEGKENNVSVHILFMLLLFRMI